MDKEYWQKTELTGKRKTNDANEILLDCVENTSHDNHYYIYDRTHVLNSWLGLERSKIMERVSHEIIGKNGVKIYIICDSPRMTKERAIELARGYYNGNTLSYRLD